MEDNKNITTEYIQFSKRVTKWGMILTTAMFLVCMAVLLLVADGLHSSDLNIITTLFTTYITIMAVIIGAYQGNSSLEKWTKAKYQCQEIVNNCCYNNNDD